ncbi:DUF6159 family protein [Halochromatium salexigens]|uniref:Cupin fold metalloprotein WbuC cupin domain-containing protein n=1 Tax=Halochromatium salexigens TaxID=49447 RepID=A0AAJ0UF42_HALSE|nr:hypothetical protein [Halochromatium salexigens]
MKPFPLAIEAPDAKVIALTTEMLAKASAMARQSPRGRIIQRLQKHDDAPLHRMVNAMQPGSYARPHRHSNPPKAEAFIVLSGAVLSAEKGFMLYPLLAGLGILLFSALILGGGGWLLLSHPEFEQLLSQLEQPSQDGDAPWWAYAAGAFLLWLFLLVTSFITHFFLTALVGGTLERLHGGNPSVGDGLALARQRAGVILGYSAITATVGLLLSFLRGRDQQPGIGFLLASLGGFAWGVATFLVIPVLAAKDIGPIAAIKESVGLLKRTWGEQLSVNVGLGLIIGLPMLLLMAGTFAGGFWAASTEQPVLMIATIATGVTLIALLSLMSATLNAMIRSAVYLYAETEAVLGGQVAFRLCDHPN